ncbi:uracil phosphoribosyltransferase [Cytophagales bacterium LB-30]|uniref:Uracil phosphoribosyltransferase n=1 Tax=Shiella aurantiaca TaxID=3058365 RepID=A0ABT8F7M0_9BACT|nr:uracil phosphoribosyltransferase [Shiella aurantiaca]MDN4166369.1 uracil phosphoribosyltransferase [Shiella aurantiaca]
MEIPIHILNESPSIADQYLFEIRDIGLQKDRLRFRKNMERLGTLMAYELSKRLNYAPQTAHTPLGTCEIPLVKDEVVLITVLRAGLPFYQGFTEVFDHQDSGFIGAYRAKHEGPDVHIELNYAAAPKLDGKTVLIIDPMLATGKSIVRTLEVLKPYGEATHYHIASVIGAPEGIDYLKRNLPANSSVWIWAVDSHLNEKAYIIPGLGDAGDLSYGEKE